MANHLYSYTSSTYGAGGSSSRYLAADSLPSALSSSSMLYDPDSYSTGFPGMSSHVYAPPGVDVGSSMVTSDSIYTGLKRNTSESLYYQTLLGIHNKIGQTEAWYSAYPLAKRSRYESTSHLPIYPQRLGEKDCAYYMQTRTCKFGDSCKFDHPIWVPEGGIPDWKEIPPVPSESLPERPGEPDCPYYLKTQKCKFGIRCKFNHPKDRIAALGATLEADPSILPERPSEPPCAFYMKTGKCKFGSACKFHHPKDVLIQLAGGENPMPGDAKPVQPTSTPASLHNSKGLPIRPGEEDCPFYIKTGSCKYGATCRYNHPDRYAVGVAPTLLTSPSTHYNIGVVAPTASLLPTFDPRLTQTTLGLGAAIYPQRPGQTECDYYMKTGICKFGTTCKFHHPVDRSTPTASATESQQQNVKLSLAGLPRREGAINCPYYMKTGTCKYGATCKFDHPPPGEVMAMGSSPSGGEGNENGAV
ncbi:zinc finger CCCH domain-containing protein 37-like isoform X2 [Andrographis paniculata]|uniref:zinc finger CCCH domain-containing protein 37-like isoform X2 n=1 Tax=Andrographis paniculata TaxID=175694 RepID=UPI0021E911F1|nr:zinc finger CCCH domain-containing protein 37-like isoform X2 [Andrographis paniculata]